VDDPEVDVPVLMLDVILWSTHLTHSKFSTIPNADFNDALLDFSTELCQIFCRI